MDARDSRDAARRLRRGVNLTLPVVLASAMTVTMNLTVPVESADAAPHKPLQPRSAIGRSSLPRAAAAAPVIQAAAVAPQRYTVAAGDSVSAIAERFGLSTASVLARNGLGWKSLIFPGQVLTLTGDAPAAPQPVAAQPVAAVTPAPAAGTGYTIVRGDTVSGIAQRFGVSTQAVLDANGLTRASVIYPGRTLTIPTASAPAAQSDIELVADVAPIAPPTTTGYTIKTGDTISSIASAFGVSASAVLQANGLGAGSIIYAGRTLVIPVSAPLASGSGLTAEMAANARTIIAVGRQLGVPDRGIVIALATAMQESGLRNLPHGDRDSVGVFQQRPSTGWGQPAQLMDVAYAARLFYGGPSNPNAGRTKGLLDIPGWSSMTLTQAAQRVQISAFPDAYAPWEPSAVNWLNQLG